MTPLPASPESLPSRDALSDVLHGIRLQGAAFEELRAFAPWKAAVPRSLAPASRQVAGAGQVIACYLIAEGSCWGVLEGERPVRLEEGDVVLFPHGDGHLLASEPPGTAGAARRERPMGSPEGPLPPVRRGGGEGRPPTQVVRGALGCEAPLFTPLLSSLPRMVHLRGGGRLLQLLARVAVAESVERRPGAAAAVARLAELLLVEVLRRHVGTLPAQHAGWLAGLRDAFVGRALALLHERPARGWSLGALAAAVGMSRSALAERFVRFVGTPPMQYLAGWRMHLAAARLADGSASVAEVAGAVGYGSEAAFSRAFKRLVGVPPAAWREARRGGEALPGASLAGHSLRGSRGRGGGGR